MNNRIDALVLVSADKDFCPALNRVRDETPILVETGIWIAKPGGAHIGRIRLEPDRPDLGEAPFHPLSFRDFCKLEDKTDYRYEPVPNGWRGPVPAAAHRTNQQQPGSWRR